MHNKPNRNKMALTTLHSSHILSLKPHLHIIKSQHSSSSSSKPTSQSNGSAPSTSSQGQGFGPKPEKKAGGRREKGSVTRRAPVENPPFVGLEREKGRAAEEDKQFKGESGFLLTWLGLGGVILFQGLALSVSGFLPEDWDKFLVKYLYPTFTPTVFLFFAGTVTYGVLKYLQNEKLKN